MAHSTRRNFLKDSAALGAFFTVPTVLGSSQLFGNDPLGKPRIAAIGVGGSRGRFNQGRGIARAAARFGDMIAVCDVDSLHNDEFNEGFDGKLATYTDYRKLLEKEKPDVVTIGTPDHWHAPIAIAALQSGAHVYCEKPLTLTIEEGFRIRDAVASSGKVFQVGTQQRSEYDQRFLQAIAIVQSGRLGENVNAYCAIGSAPGDGPFETTPVPEGLDWDMWLGPAPEADYSDQRRLEFRWFFEYSGGKMTDWGAHHIDISQWALGYERSGPVKISGTGNFPSIVPQNFDWEAYFKGTASLPNGFNTAMNFGVDLEFENGAKISVHDYYRREDGTHFPNGILFEGEKGRIYVNRDRLTGKPVEEMSEEDKEEIAKKVVELNGGKEPRGHMHNFFDCIENGGVPVSDVETHHRTMTSCHLSNIALMLGRELKWDPQQERFVNDAEADALIARPSRSGFEA